ncbi:MAG: hypothetical protein KGZ61_06515 [Sandarakinorhabdus sp.]|nr:hypothetical protein [Sandarakinorhabdus sp.]
MTHITMDIGPADTPPHSHCNSAVMEALIADSKPILIDLSVIDDARRKLDSGFWAGSLDALLLVTERAFQIPRRELLSGSRVVDVCDARHALIWAARRLTPWSLPMIGKRIGRDHSTVIHALKRAERKRARDLRYRVLTDAMVPPQEPAAEQVAADDSGEVRS